MDKLMADLKEQIIAQLNLQDVKPEDIDDELRYLCAALAAGQKTETLDR